MPPFVNILPTGLVIPTSTGDAFKRDIARNQDAAEAASRGEYRNPNATNVDEGRVDNSLLCRLSREWREVAYFLKLFGASETVDRCRFATREQQEAFAAYEGLNESPFTKVTIPIRGADGRTWNKTVSIADMGFVDPAEPQLKRDVIALIQSAIEAGIVSYGPGNASDFAGLPEQSVFVTDPKRLVRFPDQLEGLYPLPADYSGGGCNQGPESVPKYWPIPRGYRQLYITPRALRHGADGVSDDTLIDFMERAVYLAWRYLGARNVNPAFHPAVIAAQVPQLPRWPVQGANDHETSKLTRWAQGNMGAVWMPAGRTDDMSAPKIPVTPDMWRRDAIPGWNMPAPNATPMVVQPTIRGPSDALWRQSLRVRHPRMGLGAYTLDGVYVRDGRLTTVHADALKDVLSALVMLQAVVDCGDYSQHGQGVLADIAAAGTVFNIVQREAYRTIGMEYGTSFAAYSTAVDEERRTRENRWRSEIVSTFGNTGYQSQGDTKGDILAATIGSAGLAIAAASALGPTGAIVCVAVLGMAALLKYLSRGTPPPDKREWGVRAKSDGACVWGGSATFNKMAVKDVLAAGCTPFVRVE